MDTDVAARADREAAAVVAQIETIVTASSSRIAFRNASMAYAPSTTARVLHP